MRFRPRYYQQHKGLKFYKPWTYKLWDKPVAGWCSWFAFWNRVTEKDIKQTTDVLAVRLLPYGLEYIQLDDGFEQINGTPDKWLNPNKKFPSGLESLASYITSKGFKPGIRGDVSFHDARWAKQHPQYFIKDKNGEVPREPWVGYPVDATNIRALDKLVRPIYSGLRQQGWKYIKLDSLRHLRYEGYNRHKDYFRKKNTTAVEALRTYVTAVKEELGDNILFMGCWGIRPELTGMIDICRVGGDGFSYAGLAQYNSFNNVVWLNDPDHIQLTPKEAYRSTMATSLTGSMYMLTDKPEVYNGEIIEAARRTIPVLRTLPGQVYEVDPGRIEHLADYEIEVSGTNHRPFDASLTSFVDLYQLDIHTSYESWVLLGRTANHEPGIDMKDLGLKPDKDYLVFEFWSKTYLGSFTGHIDFPDIDPKYHCQAFCIRERQLQPQLVATSRHISCGALEVSQLKAANTKDGFSLEGISVLVGEDPYVLYLTEPAGYQFKEIRVNGADVIKNEKQGMIRKITLRRKQSGQVKWELLFNH
jgi:alpha-galactosidase